MDEHAFERRIAAAAGGEDGRESSAKVADLAVAVHG
jgi:hypothetical protein